MAKTSVGKFGQKNLQVERSDQVAFFDGIQLFFGKKIPSYKRHFLGCKKKLLNIVLER